MTVPHPAPHAPAIGHDEPKNRPAGPARAQVIALRLPGRLQDPLRLMQDEAPSETGRIVLWTVSILILALIVWAALGKLDIVATAEGKLVPKTLVKIVQPAEAGVVRELLVNEGDSVKAGQVLARLDTTLVRADTASVASDLGIQQMQERRILAELDDQLMLPKAGDDPQRYAQVHSQYLAHRKAYLDGMDQEKSLLAKAEHERKSAAEILDKLEQTLPTYQKAAEAYARLEKDGFIGGLAAAEKRREAIEKEKDLDAQRSTVAALNATIAAQNKKISQLQSTYKSELQKELADVRGRIAQLQPTLNKTLYREGLMELRAPQDGTVKDLATTTVGAVVQPGTVLLTLVPAGERLFADVSIRNEDVGFVQVGQSAQIKLAAYPFQKHGMLSGQVIQISADATQPIRPAASSYTNSGDTTPDEMTGRTAYEARIRLDTQVLLGPDDGKLQLASGMEVMAEIHQGTRTVLEYLLSPVRKAAQEAGRER